MKWIAIIFITIMSLALLPPLETMTAKAYAAGKDDEIIIRVGIPAAVPGSSGLGQKYEQRQAAPILASRSKILGAVLMSMLPVCSGSWLGGWDWGGFTFTAIKAGSFVTAMMGAAKPANTYYYEITYNPSVATRAYPERKVKANPERGKYLAIGFSIYSAAMIADMIYSPIRIKMKSSRRTAHRAAGEGPESGDAGYHRVAFTVMPLDAPMTGYSVKNTRQSLLSPYLGANIGATFAF